MPRPRFRFDRLTIEEKRALLNNLSPTEKKCIHPDWNGENWAGGIRCQDVPMHRAQGMVSKDIWLQAKKIAKQRGINARAVMEWGLREYVNKFAHSVK